MMDQEVRRLTRAELIEIIYRLQIQEEQMRKKLEALECQLADKKLDIAESGSIAEAALRLNGVFDAAQRAADQYCAEVNRRTDQMSQRVLKETKRQAAAILAEAQRKHDAILEEAKREAAARAAETGNGR